MLPGDGWLLSLVRTISSFPCCVPGFLFSVVVYTLSGVVGDGFSVSAQLRISSRNNCEYGVLGVVTFVGGRGPLVQSSFSSIGEAMTLCSDEKGDNG